MKKLKDLMNESVEFTVTVAKAEPDLDMQQDHYGKFKPENIEVQSFKLKKDANKFKREMMKKYDMVKTMGHIVNFSKQLEISTNY